VKLIIQSLVVGLLLLSGSALTAAPPPSEIYLKKKFQELDKNRDGRLSREEYLAAWTYDRKMGEQRFKEVDQNGDGYITLKEYLNDVKKSSQPQPGNQQKRY